MVFINEPAPDAIMNADEYARQRADILAEVAAIREASQERNTDEVEDDRSL